MPPIQTEQVVLPQPDLPLSRAQSAPRPQDSDPPHFPQPIAPPAGAPNVLLILVDDAGFGQFGTFGGAVPDPHRGHAGQRGPQVQPLPHHRAVLADARGADHRPQPSLGQRRRRRRDRLRLRRLHQHHPARAPATVAETLQLNGYSTAWFGKNHNVPAWEHSPAGPFDHWPPGWASTTSTASSAARLNQWQPMLWENTTPVMPYLDNPDYILNVDLADKAIAWIDNVTTFAPDKPYFCYFCPGATHAPHQVPAEWSDRFKGQFDAGLGQVPGGDLRPPEGSSASSRRTRCSRRGRMRFRPGTPSRPSSRR